MKVGEAKGKICPFVIGTNSVDSFKEIQKCVCGDCMAWKDTPTIPVKCMGVLVPTGGAGDNYFCMVCNTQYLNIPDSMLCEKIIPTPESEKEGYCARIGQ